LVCGPTLRPHLKPINKNSAATGHRVVEIPASNLKKKVTKILFEQGYILSYKFEDTTVQGTIKIALKYDAASKEPVIKKLQRVSTPGLRKYVNASEMPRVLNGLGIAIVSTSKGVMTNKKARQENVGGEVLCYVY
jgi:small subunit ribosomal protein S8